MEGDLALLQAMQPSGLLRAEHSSEQRMHHSMLVLHSFVLLLLDYGFVLVSLNLLPPYWAYDHLRKPNQVSRVGVADVSPEYRLIQVNCTLAFVSFDPVIGGEFFKIRLDESLGLISLETFRVPVEEGDAHLR